MSEFITITEDEENITSPMPPDETVVDVMLSDGTVCQAYYCQHFVEPGDWDFLPIDAAGEPNIEGDNFIGRVVAWRTSRTAGANPAAPRQHMRGTR